MKTAKLPDNGKSELKQRKAIRGGKKTFKTESISEPKNKKQKKHEIQSINN